MLLACWANCYFWYWVCFKQCHNVNPFWAMEFASYAEVAAMVVIVIMEFRIQLSRFYLHTRFGCREFSNLATRFESWFKWKWEGLPVQRRKLNLIIFFPLSLFLSTLKFASVFLLHCIFCFVKCNEMRARARKGVKKKRGAPNWIKTRFKI